MAISGCAQVTGGTGAFIDVGVARSGTLVAYKSCDDALAKLRAALLANPFATRAAGTGVDDKAAPPGAAVPQPATGAGESTQSGKYTGTNTQEVGVDEPDLVKTDGTVILAAQAGVLRVVDAQTKRVQAQLTYDAQGRQPADLLLAGDHVLLLTRPAYVIGKGPGLYYGGGLSQLQLIDIGGGGASVLATYTVTGDVVAARQIGSTARVVIRSGPSIAYPTDFSGTFEEQQARIRQIINAAPIESFLPHYTSTAGGHTKQGHVDCANVARPEAYSGTSMVSILTFDLGRDELGDGQTRTVITDGDTVYASATNLYVSNDSRWQYPVAVDLPVGPAVPAPDSAGPGAPQNAGSGTAKREAGPTTGATGSGTAGGGSAVPPDAATATGSGGNPGSGGGPSDVVEPVQSPAPGPVPTQPAPDTEIYKFDIAGSDPARLVATGKVPGWTLNQYSFSEYQADLRVATTASAARSESAVSVLRQHGNKLSIIGTVGGLGRGENIYAVRFLGPIGYVVTFRQVDPLYVLDLRDPTAPKVTGELKIPGYSSYLHPIGDGRLVGIGQAATDRGQVQGTQLSLFDVTDPAHPARLDQRSLPYTRSEAEFDPHAFLYWSDLNLVVIPIVEQGAVVFQVDGDSLVRLGSVAKPRYPYDYSDVVRRSLIVDGLLWTLSERGLVASDPTTLSQQAEVTFN
jgi:hypothetical protein